MEEKQQIALLLKSCLQAYVRVDAVYIEKAPTFPLAHIEEHCLWKRPFYKQKMPSACWKILWDSNVSGEMECTCRIRKPFKGFWNWWVRENWDYCFWTFKSDVCTLQNWQTKYVFWPQRSKYKKSHLEPFGRSPAYMHWEHLFLYSLCFK